ncbi:MAG: lipid-A-disaccharide synthase N-terminal domain-containing protein [Planctomycetes bacterium]|nr:lipid-A-disaccharide synthase N-terminal domain-containing protein [Planctomycetota bacterium]
MNDWLDQVLTNAANPIALFGFLAQLVFFMRFVVQWISTERNRKSVIPVAFWYISITGGIMLLTYGILDHDPVIIMGQSFAIIVYARNLYFIHKHKNYE